jgi:hypothetical protein
MRRSGCLRGFQGSRTDTVHGNAMTGRFLGLNVFLFGEYEYDRMVISLEKELRYMQRGDR